MKNMSADNKEAGIYIVDQDYNILYLNDKAKTHFPSLKNGMNCYEIFEKNTYARSSYLKIGQTSEILLFYNDASSQWLILSCAHIDWPGHNGCRLIVSQPVNEKNKNIFCNLIDTSFYNELFEVNLVKKTYKVLFHEKGKKQEVKLAGNLDSLCQKVVSSLIHPEDKDRFLEFCELSTVRKRLSSNSMKLRGEFRKKLYNDKYTWIGITIILFNEPIVLCYIQDIDKQKKEEEREWERDSLTGLLRYGHFFEKTRKLIDKYYETEFYLVAIDINHFKLFNEWYGEKEGDRFLIKIAKQLKLVVQDYDSVAGYMGGDDFAIVFPANHFILKKLDKVVGEYARLYGDSAGFLPAFGVYRIEDRNISISTMYDRAMIALDSVKENYSNRVGWYEPSMKLKMENDQVLLSEVQRAMKNHEFIFYVQPQCNMLTGKIIGMESLVRWQHPVRGLVLPGDFIPILERTGFITSLDMYIWEKVCQYQNQRKKSGHSLIPISVNMSRIDIYAIDVVEKFKSLIHTYKFDPKYLEIEVTESAYAEDNDLIRRVVEELRGEGFPVFMDDFGSGYSSLNMLKDVNMDVIKIDTKFLDMNESSKSRGLDILETIVRLAKVMQLKIIAEGVEKKEQADFLINIGCIYGQGYYYYKPLPLEEVDKLLSEVNHLDFKGIQAYQMKILKLEDIFNENIASQLMIHHMLGAIALYKVCEDKCEILRVNEEYYYITGDNPEDIERQSQVVLNKVHRDDKDWVLSIFDKAYSNPIHGAEGIFRRYRKNGELIWLRLRAYFLREQDGNCYYYGSVQDATEQMEQRKKLEDSQKVLGEVLNIAGNKNQWAVSSMIAQTAPVGLLSFYCEEGLPVCFANKKILDVLEYDTYERFVKEIEGQLIHIFRPEAVKEWRRGSLRKESSLQQCLRKRDGSWASFIIKARAVQVEEGRRVIVCSCMESQDIG